MTQIRDQFDVMQAFTGQSLTVVLLQKPRVHDSIDAFMQTFGRNFFATQHLGADWEVDDDDCDKLVSR